VLLLHAVKEIKQICVVYFRGAASDVLPPGMPMSKSIKPYTTFELDQFRQLART